MFYFKYYTFYYYAIKRTIVAFDFSLFTHVLNGVNNTQLYSLPCTLLLAFIINSRLGFYSTCEHEYCKYAVAIYNMI